MGSLSFEITKKKAIAMSMSMWLYPTVCGTTPPERWGHSACFSHSHSHSHGFMCVFGGCCRGLHLSEVLMLNLETMVWSTLLTKGKNPGPRDSHSAILVGRKMMVFGGTNGLNKVNDLHILDLFSKEWTSPDCVGTAPSPRESHTATLLREDKLVIFGGSGEGESNYLNDLHILDLKSMRWSSPLVKGALPVARDSHSAVGINNKLYVYGGDCGNRYHGDVDVFDLVTLTWSKLGVRGIAPGLRAGHAAVNIGRKIYVIGGVGEKHYYNDVWILDVSTCAWSRLDLSGQHPLGRFSHTAVVTGSDIAIYGGCGEDERPTNELLVLQLGIEYPNARYNLSVRNHSGLEKRQCFCEAETNLKQKQKQMQWRINSGVCKGAVDQDLVYSDNLHRKRRRSENSKTWEVDQEQEDNLLLLSSPSAITPSQGFPSLNNRVSIRPNNATIGLEKQESYQQMVHRLHKPIHILDHKVSKTQNMVGADIHGKVDGAFETGFFITANVNGKNFRGVLFSPETGPGTSSRVAMFPPNRSPGIMRSNHRDAEWGRVYGQKPEEATTKLTSDFQDVFLTLGGPGTKL